MLTLLTIGVGLLGYSIIGYFLGRATIQEFFDDTPTKELSLWGYIRRRFLFPVNSSSWDKRANENEPIGFCECLREEGNKINRGDQAVQKTLKLTMTFWPLKIFPTVLAIFILIVHAGSWLMGVISGGMDRVLKQTLRISRLRGSVATSDDLVVYNRLKEFRASELHAHIASLKGVQDRTHDRSAELAQAISEWKALMVSAESVDLQINAERYHGIVELLEGKLAANQSLFAQIESVLGVLNGKAEQVGLLVAIFEQHMKTGALLGDEGEELRTQAIDQACAAMESCRTLCEGVGKMETGILANRGETLDACVERELESRAQQGAVSLDESEALKLLGAG